MRLISKMGEAPKPSETPQESPKSIPKPPQNRRIILVILALVLILTSVVVLKSVPLKYEESNYREDFTLVPQAEEGRWLNVKKGYTVSGTYSATDNNPVVIAVYPPETTFLLSVPSSPPIVFSNERSSGSFSFQAEIEGKYLVDIKNPASSGFLGFGVGATITVTTEIKVSGYTTYL